MRTAAVLLGVALIAACSEAPEPASNAVTVQRPQPKPEPTATTPAAPLAPGELPAPELAGARTASGGWERRSDGEGDAALFGEPGGVVRFAVRCDAAQRRIRFERAGEGASMRIVTASAAAAYPAEPGSALPTTVASAGIDDRFVADALTRTGGTIGIQLDDGPVLAVPANGLVSQVIEGCGS